MQWMAKGLVVMVLLGGFAKDLAAQEWSRFRGRNGAGVSSGVGFPGQWTDADYRWKQRLPGKGHSSPVLWGRRLFVTSGDEKTGRRFVICLDAVTGTQRWQRDFPADSHRKHQLNSYASSTPVVDRERLYVSWGTPSEVTVVALDHQGKTVWQRSLGAYQGGHGYGVSPIRVGGLLVLADDQAGNSRLMALNCMTGQTVWLVERESKSAYATPCLLPSAGGSEALIFTNWEQGIVAVDSGTGKTQWAADVFDKSHVESSIGSPVMVGDLVLGTCGWLGHGNEVVAVRPPDRPGTPPTLVYRITRGAPLCTTPLAYEGLLFLWSDNGIVTCADAQSGKVHWTKRIGNTFYASPVCVDKRIYNVDVDGTVVVLAASRQYQLLGRNDLGEASHSTPAVAGGGVYFRTLSQIFCLAGERFFGR